MAKRSASKKSKQSVKKSKPAEKKVKTGGKRQPSGYLMFCAEQRTRRNADFKKMKPKEIMQSLGAEWRKLSAQQQEAYKTKACSKSCPESSDKIESTSQKSQSHKGSAIHRSNNKSGSKTKRSVKKHPARAKGVAKKKKHGKKAKKTRGKSAHHHEAGTNPVAE